MHYSTYVLIPKEQAASSAEARKKASAYLLENEFCSADGRWGHGLADYFLIGGRWSGKLSYLRLDQKKLTRFWKRFEKLRLGYCSLKITKEQKHKKIEALFLKYFPNFNAAATPVPSTREDFWNDGYDDDAMIVDDLIWQNIIEPGLKQDLLEGGAIIHVDGSGDCESELKKEEVVGKCWCVVIDFHT